MHYCMNCGDRSYQYERAPQLLKGRAKTGISDFTILGRCHTCDHYTVRYGSGHVRAWAAHKVHVYSKGQAPTYGDLMDGKKYFETKKRKAKKMKTNKTLYEMQIAEAGNSTRMAFGHRLAVNSQGMWIMEERGTGLVHVMPKELVIEVMPYTVGIKFIGGSRVYHYYAKEGQVNVGDLVMLDKGGAQSFAEVVEVDTKSRVANVWLTGWRVGVSMRIDNEGEEAPVRDDDSEDDDL